MKTFIELIAIGENIVFFYIKTKNKVYDLRKYFYVE
jgi:hypothetical protein